MVGDGGYLSRFQRISVVLITAFSKVCTVRALVLLSCLVDLLELCLTKEIWECCECDIIRNVVKLLRETFIKFGDTIEYIR